jgi:hypothetical protein
MPSPFPGMNPYLEQPDVWNDFHQTVLTYLRERLVAAVAPDYYVRIDEHLYIRDVPDDEQRFAGRGDLAVTRPPNGRGHDSSVALLAAPARGRLPIPEYERQPFLEVRDRRSHEVVTVIELLSPSNKHGGKDRDHYLTKRDEIVWSPAHFIEIDLLRGGVRPPIEDLPACDYYVLVSRVEDRPEVELWPFLLRDPIPVIPVPLRSPHPDAQLDLRPALDRAYDAANYGAFIYESPPTPRLAPDASGWAQQFIPRARE